MNEIVVYQPNEVTRLEVMLRDDTVWLSQEQVVSLFERDRSVISRHIKNAIDEGEICPTNCLQKMQTNAKGRPEVMYDLDVVISVGYRVKSVRGTQFRRWATKVLREYWRSGCVIDVNYASLAKEVDRRMAAHEKRLEALEDQVQFVVAQALPPPEKVFLNGEVLDAQAELTRIVKTAKRRVVLIDNYIDERTLLLLGSRADNVACTIYTLKPESPKLAPALANYTIEYPTKPIEIKGFKKAHDRFLVVDDTLWHIGASLKDAGLNLFAMMKMTLSPDVILSLLPH